MCTGCAHDIVQMRNGCEEDVSGYYWKCTRCVQEVQMCTGCAHDKVQMRNGGVENVYRMCSGFAECTRSVGDVYLLCNGYEVYYRGVQDV